MVVAAGSLLFGGLVLLPVAMIVDHPWTLRPTSEALVAVVAMGIFSSAFGLMLFYMCLTRLGTLTTNAQGYLRIPIGVGLSVLLLGETVPANLALGLVLVMAGVAAMTIPGEQYAEAGSTGCAAGRRPRSRYFFSSSSLRYFSTSRVTSCCSTSGAMLVGVGRDRRQVVEALLHGSLSTAVFAAALSFAMIAGGVPFGANRPFQPCASNSGSPASAEVGRSGSVASRTVEPTTSPCTSLSSIACDTEAAASQTPSIWPPIASVSAGAAPR